MQVPVAWLVRKGTSVFVSLYLGNGSDFYLKGVRPLLRETFEARGHAVGATREQGPAAEVEVAAPPRNGGDLRKSAALAWAETPCGGGGPVWSPSRTPAPTPAQPSLPAPTLAGGRAAPKPSAHALTSAPLPPSPAPTFHVSLPLALPRRLGSSSAATIGYGTSSSRPINATPSPPCYWVEQNKNKQSERGQRRSEAAAEAEERGRGRQTGDPGERRRPEGVSTVGAARTLWRAASSSRWPRVGGGGRTLGGGGGVEASPRRSAPASEPSGHRRPPNARGCEELRVLAFRGWACRAGALQRGPAPLLRSPFPGGGARVRSRPRGAPGRSARRS